MNKGRLRCSTIKFPSEYSHRDTWVSKVWNGLTSFDGYNIWTDGTNIYYSDSSKQYVLNGDTWVTKTWGGMTSFNGYDVWTDGTNIYYSYNNNHYVLNGDTWVAKTWSGLTSFYGRGVWTDGTNIYYSYGNTPYILNGDTWVVNTWNGLTSFSYDRVWTDGTNIYYSDYNKQYVLNGDTWVTKTWGGLTSFNGSDIWSDGTDIYCSKSGGQYVLNGDTWVEKTWNELSPIAGSNIWTDGTNILFSNTTKQYVLERTAPEPAPLDPKSMLMGWIVGRRIAGQRDTKTIVGRSGYSYNGVQLPALPAEWDKTKYPYAAITYTSNESSSMYTAMVFLLPSVEYVVDDYGGRCIKIGADALICNAFGYTPEELLDGWGDLYAWDRDHYYSITEFTWSNFDILNEDGSVYLKASEPIPVYA